MHLHYFFNGPLSQLSAIHGSIRGRGEQRAGVIHTQGRFKSFRLKNYRFSLLNQSFTEKLGGQSTGYPQPERIRMKSTLLPQTTFVAP